VPDNAADERIAGDRAEASTIDAVGAGADDKEPVLGQQGSDLFDHGAIVGVAESDDVPGLQSAEQEGDSAHEHKIPFLVIRDQAVA
jgi:hypothetical protein